MIAYQIGNLLDSDAQALVNTVNTVGVMGKGIALQFKKQFPNNYKQYQNACKDNQVVIGKMLIVEEMQLTGKKLIINFPTKTDWRKPSEYSYIKAGLKALKIAIAEYEIKSIALPPLGAGNGGLDWAKVKDLITQELGAIDCSVTVYEPTKVIEEALRKERVNLTPARAMLLAVLYELVGQGEFASEFASEKICYFLQRFGGADLLKLSFNRSFYGPYSGKVKHILFYLNGSYLSGYGDKDKKPFEAISVLMDAQTDVQQYLDMPTHSREKEIVAKTKQFLRGFYDDFGLELLSTLDYIITEYQTTDLAVIRQQLSEWSERKKMLFAKDAFLEIGISKLKSVQFI